MRATVIQLFLASAVVCIYGQETKPLFVTGDELERRRAEDERAKIERTAKDLEARELADKQKLNQWVGKKFWFVPRPNSLRSLRFGFATALTSDALQESALLFPTDVISFTVVDVQFFKDPARLKKGDYLKVKFDNGPFAFFREDTFAARLSLLTSASTDGMDTGQFLAEIGYLNNQLHNSRLEGFFMENPVILLANFNKALVQHEANLAKKEQIEAAKKRTTAANNPRGGSGSTSSKSGEKGTGGCDRAGARSLLAKMRPDMVASVSFEDEWVVVTFGRDYIHWNEAQREALVTAYSNADACVTGQARSLEFRSPTGKLVARADRVRGIQMK